MIKFEDILMFFVNLVLPPTILTLGLVGNTLGILTLQKKKLKNIGPLDTYRYLFYFDSFFLLQIIGTNLQNTYSLDITILSNLSCGLWYYFNYSFSAISPWLIVYIAVERYISMKQLAKRFAFR